MTCVRMRQGQYDHQRWFIRIVLAWTYETLGHKSAETSRWVEGNRLMVAHTAHLWLVRFQRLGLRAQAIERPDAH